MNRSYDFVSNSLLNTSKSKQAHRFPQAQRRLLTTASPCRQSFYNLGSTMMASTLQMKQSILPRDTRFKSNATIAPSPTAYLSKSFIQLNRSAQKGAFFTKEVKLVNRSKNFLNPSPCTYDTKYNPETKLSYTMRNKVKQHDHRPNVGPGQYNVQNYDAIDKPNQVSSKYNTAKVAKISLVGSAKRFNPKANLTPGPGPFGYNSMIKTEKGVFPRYDHGTKKEPSYIRKNSNPAPDYYNKFSQFSQRPQYTHYRSTTQQ